MAPYRILITGSRDWEDADVISFNLGLVLGEASREGHHLRDAVIVHGDCPKGADAIADRLACNHGYTVERHPANWDQYGKAAGFRRNADMVNLGADICLAFIRNKSRGASHTAELAEKAGIPVQRYERN